MKLQKSLPVLLAGMILILSSCKKEWLDTYPTTSVAAADAVKSTQNAWAALNGIHRVMYTQYDGIQGCAGEGSINIFRDLMGEDIVYPLANGSTGLIGWLRWQAHRNENDGFMRFSFRFYYRLISNANVLIAGIDAAQGPEADKRYIKGQALAYRAWSHFQLVQLWAERYKAGETNSQPGVPLLLENTLVGQPRATVEDVYTQINKDLAEAATLLVGYTRTGSAPKSNFNVNVVRGIQARVALVQGKWDEAATHAIAARQGFTLMSNAQYLEGFNNAANPEWIWGSTQISDHNTFFYSYFAYMSANFNSTVLRTQPRAINANLWNSIPSTDIRKQCWDLTGATVPIPPGGARVPYQNKKYMAASSSLSIGDIVYMRAAEMFLIEAEARARQGQFTAAQDALFTLVRNRDASYQKSTSTGQALIDEILWNRRVEFWGEGFRFTDLKRLNLPMSRVGIPNHLIALIQVQTVPAGDKQWQFLFPRDELNQNPAVVQNPL